MSGYKDSRAKGRSGRIVVVAAVIERDGTFLLAKRGAGSRLAGLWEFAGGKVEAGETREQALRREIREEMGVDIVVNDGAPVAVVPWDYDHASVEVVAMRARIVTGKPLPLDHAELGWFTPEEMAGMDLVPADRPVVDRLQSRTD